MREQSIFIEALEREDPAEREAFLDRACAADPALRPRIERLFRRHEQADDVLDAPPAWSAATLDQPIAEGAGTLIGPYKLLEQIGEGGMGAVYVAEQSQPVRRRVALKVIKLGMDTKQVIARFEAERQALAMMDHPNIARVLDAGATETGRPYFVMELVRGIPITDYCDREQLSIPERLELFVLVCRAVQHAHQKGIIHRDLKPSNILVTVIDGAAVPKIIDFGVAKATGASLTDRTIYTAFHQFVGTPLYMSPEQADLSGMDMDTRSDIYSLGVLLYELLTGTTPIDRDTFRQATFDEMRRMIRENEPPRPSTRLSSLGETRSTVSANRKADARHLDRTVLGELDWIVMKALEKDRRRRYETANDFASDVMRHLTDQPVEACPPSAGYRLRKFSRRNRRWMATAVAIGVVLVAATAVSVWQAGLARKAQRRATTEATIARQAQRKAEAAEARAATEAAIARAVNDFLRDDLLGQAERAPQFGEDLGTNRYLTVKDALDRAANSIDRRFRDQPLVEASIRTTIGSAYHSLGEDGFAVPHFERALTLHRAHLGASHPDTLRSMLTLVDAYGWVKRFPPVVDLAYQILLNRRAVLGPNHPEVLGHEARLAEAYELPGQWETSRQLMEDLLPRLVKILGRTHSTTLNTMHHLAMTYRELDRFDESIALYENGLGLRETINDPEHVPTIWMRLTFAQVCQRAGKLDKADRVLRKTLELLRAEKDTLSQRVGMANTLGWLARNEVLLQQYVEAESHARQAVRIFADLRPREAGRFYWVSVLGGALLGQQRYAEAEPLLLQGYEGMKQAATLRPVDPRRLIETVERLVRFYEVTQQPEKAQQWREILSTLPPPH